MTHFRYPIVAIVLKLLPAVLLGIVGPNLSALQADAATVTLVASPSPAIFGAPVTLTATVVPSNATGYVTFYDDSAVLGTAYLSGGTAQLHVSITSTGNRRLFARYLGDGQNALATSAVTIETVDSLPAFGFTSTVVHSGIGPLWGAAGDFNNDGKQDLVITGSSGLIKTLLGNGDGTFGTPVTTFVGGGPYSYVAVADFDGDGKQDIVFSGGDNVTPSVLFGNGDGSFGGLINLPTGNGPTIVADFNGDGIPDVAIQHRIGWTVGVLLGTGTRTFGAPIEYALGTFACATYFSSGPCGGYDSLLVSGDLNGDNLPDIVAVEPSVNEQNRFVVVLLGKAGGGFQTAVQYPLSLLSQFEPTDFPSLTDFNGDGKLDLVVAPGYGSSVVIFMGNGDGTFADPVAYRAEDIDNGAATGMVTLDFNGDQQTDIVLDRFIVVSGGHVQHRSLILGNGDGTFQNSDAEPFLTVAPFLLIPADFNGDGLVDFASMNRDGTNDFVAIYQGAVLPLLRLSVSHTGTLSLGQTGVPFTINVSNSGGLPTSGVVTVTELGSGSIQITSLGGNGWACSGMSCSRSDALTIGSSYPPLTATATIIGAQFPTVLNAVTVSGGNSAGSAKVTDSGPLVTAGACVYVFYPTTDVRGPVAGLGSVPVTTGSGCTWTATSNASWITILTGTHGNGNDTVTYSVPPNLGSTPRSGTLLIAGQNFTITQRPANSNVGVFRAGYFWLEDVNGNQQFISPPDRAFAFGGVPGDIPITGDWNGSGTTKVGVYRPSNGLFVLDYDGDGQFTAADKAYNLGVGIDPTDIPVVGDWNGDGKTKVGLFRKGFFWILDFNGNGVFEQGTDRTYAFGGVPGDVPIVGDWNSGGTTKIGLFRQGFFWILDVNGNGSIDNVNGSGGDQAFAFGGINGDVPVVGDWNGDGNSKVGVFRSGFFWVLDANGNHAFDGTATGQDLAFPFGGISGDVPTVGKW